MIGRQQPRRALQAPADQLAPGCSGYVFGSVDCVHAFKTLSAAPRASSQSDAEFGVLSRRQCRYRNSGLLINAQGISTAASRLGRAACTYSATILLSSCVGRRERIVR